MAADLKALLERYRTVGPVIVRQIVNDTIDAGGDHRDVMVLATAIMASVLCSIYQEGADDFLVSAFADQVRERLAVSRQQVADARSEAKGTA